MPDIYEVQAPDGSTLEIQSNGPPTADMAKRAIRAYGDVQAAGAQKKAEAGSTFGSQLTGRDPVTGDLNVLHDAGTVAGAGWDVLKTLVKEGWKNPLGINQPDIRYDPAAHANDPSLRDQATSVLGTLRTVPRRAWAVVTDPIGALQAAGVTPDTAARAGGTVAAVGAVGAALPNAGELTTSTGNLVTRAGQKMSPAVTKTLGEGLGALAEAGLGGASGSPTMGGLGRVFAGSKIGGAIGEAAPALTQGTGRLITKAGQFMGSANGTPAGLTPPTPPVQPNTLLRADDLKAILEEAMTQGDNPTRATAPPTDVQPVGQGVTETGQYSSGRPPVTQADYDAMQARAAQAASSATEPVPPPVTQAPYRPTPDEVVRAAQETPPAASPAETAPPVAPPTSIRDQLVASLEKAAQEQQAKPRAPESEPLLPFEGVTATEGVKPPPPTIDPEAQAVRDQTATPATADEAEAAGQPEEADTGPTEQTPARSEKSADELARDAIGARDHAAALRRQGIPATTESVRAETRARMTGGTGETSVIPLGATNRILGTLKDKIAAGASDADLLEYLNQAKTPEARKQIGLMLNSLLHGTGRTIAGVTAAAAGGAALRNALVGQLQGDQKEQD